MKSYLDRGEFVLQMKTHKDSLERAHQRSSDE